ncbi:hypothetical protein [Lysinibacillus sphaericus]|uniref:Uncharacterized protein n=2 Tax=Lysinibacillus sphaericus TaxID=1421 RepID=A0A2S0K647_LYSSH|nr:hypothetical protein [Lysinibacillus sphaericus]AVK98841.1 hypothetical protein LS41612_22395 [Lysinibacillus sphaericus]
MKKNHITNHLKRKEWERRKMAMKNKQMKKEISEKTFIFQHPGLESTLELRERAKDTNGNMSDKELYTEIMEHVVFVEVDNVPQKVNFTYFEENFESMKVFTEVMKEAIKFLFR